MISTLQFSNYKKIGEHAVRLEDLTRVNYFVGENSSGKTSVLRYIFEFNRSEALWITDNFSELDHLKEFDFKKIIAHKQRNFVKQVFLESLQTYHFLSLDLMAYSLMDARLGQKWRVFDLKIYQEAIAIAQDLGIVSEQLAVSDAGHIIELDGEELNSGAHKMIHIIYGVLWSHKKYGTQYFLFDNPGEHLHPSWQKKLPRIFEKLALSLDIQIFTATHSPFIVGAAGVLGEVESGSVLHKVYFLIDGKIASKRGVASSKGVKGYWGSKVAEISSKMLGVGLMDLISKQTPVVSKSSPVLILCEGEGENADALIYNIIFRDHKPSVLFVSSRGSTQLYKSFTLLQQIKPGLSADIVIKMLRDRDHEFPTLHSIQEYENTNPGACVLRKRAIESYIFNPDTAKLVLSLFNKKILKKDMQVWGMLQERITESVVRGEQGNGYKNELLFWFQTATRGYLRELMRDSTLTLMERIAYLIYPGHPVYQELEEIIFL